MTVAASMKQYRPLKTVDSKAGAVDATKKKADSSKGGLDTKSQAYAKTTDLARPSSTMHINMGNHKKMNGDLIEVGKKMTMKVVGTVVHHSKDEYGHTVRMNIHDIAPQGIDPHAESK